jgi:hypothetical protein
MARSIKWCPQRCGHTWSYRLPHCTRSAVWHRVVESLDTVLVPGKWFIVLTLYCSRIVVCCLHALHVLTVLFARTSCRPCQVPSKFACVCSEHACLYAQAVLLDFSLCLMPVTHREPRDTWQLWSLRHMAAPELTELEPGQRKSEWAHDGKNT